MRHDFKPNAFSSRWRAGKRNRASHVRIIAGEWRGQRIRVAQRPQLRPTPDRVRETLFNWIGSDIQDRRVLDLFAGTGALGFEALSRGASHATFVERDRKVVARLKETCEQFELDASQARVIEKNALPWLAHQQSQWDMVFMDPPFHEIKFYASILRHLKERLAEGALVYMESAVRGPAVECELEEWKCKEVGEVRMQLFSYP